MTANAWPLETYLDRLGSFLGRDELRTAVGETNLADDLSFDSLDLAQLFLLLELLLDEGAKLPVGEPETVADLYGLYIRALEMGGSHEQLELLLDEQS